jgi:hypothetical protein
MNVNGVDGGQRSRLQCRLKLRYFLLLPDGPICHACNYDYCIKARHQQNDSLKASLCVPVCHAHVHPLLGNVLVKSFREDRCLVNSPLLGQPTIEVTMFSVSAVTSQQSIVVT